VPVVRTDMNSEQMKISTLRHNRARGTEDTDLTSSLLRDLEKLGALEYAKQQLGLSDDEMDFLLKDAKATDILPSAEFGRAWEFVGEAEMAKELDAKAMGGDAAERGASVNQSPIQKSYSRKAAQNMIDLDKKLGEAKTGAERKRLKREYSIFRIVISVSQEEAKVLDAILGKKQSEAFFKICKAEYDRMEAAGELQAETPQAPAQESEQEESHV